MVFAMRPKSLVFQFLIALIFLSCRTVDKPGISSIKVRKLVDTVGFAHYNWQMDSIMARLKGRGWKNQDKPPWKFAICPHDDYTYVGDLYPELLQNVKASNLILIGVAHRAARMGIEDSLVFDSFNDWKGPWKDVPVSPAREEIFNLLRGRFAIVSDTLHSLEHSIESMIPFLQYFNRNITIVPILVPAMDTARTRECGKALADAIISVAGKRKWEWGKDYSIIVTTDAVHYGNEEWGGSDYAFFGCDSAGNAKAIKHEYEITSACLTGTIAPEKIRLFSSFTLKDVNYREYKWTWCGRYSVPLALYTVYYMGQNCPPDGELLRYTTSITSEHLPVEDLAMGHTAIASMCHWVGYAIVGYR